MRELEALLNKRWILKAEDKELYYKVRDQLGEIRKFASDKLGCISLKSTFGKVRENSSDTRKLYGGTGIYFKTGVCIFVPSFDVFGRQGSAGAIYFVAAD